MGNLLSERGNQFFFFAEDSGNKAYIYKLIKARPRYVLKTTFSSFPTVCQLLNCGECVPRLTSSYEFKFFVCLKSYLSHEMRTFWPYVKKTYANRYHCCTGKRFLQQSKGHVKPEVLMSQFKYI